MRAARNRGASIIAIFLGLALSGCEPRNVEPVRLDVASASVERDLRTGEPIVFAHLTEDHSSRRFAQFTAANMGKLFDLRVDGKTVFKPIIREPLISGIVLLPTQREEDAREIALRVTNGKSILEVATAQN
jgi:preprotein translocase subunit SecD